jgi:hypothetical protein
MLLGQLGVQHAFDPDKKTSASDRMRLFHRDFSDAFLVDIG